MRAHAAFIAYVGVLMFAASNSPLLIAADASVPIDRDIEAATTSEQPLSVVGTPQLSTASAKLSEQEEQRASTIGSHSSKPANVTSPLVFDDLQLKGEAVCSEFTIPTHNELRIYLAIRSIAIAQASGFGDVVVDTIRDEHGHDMEAKWSSDVKCNNGRSCLQPIDLFELRKSIAHGSIKRSDDSILFHIDVSSPPSIAKLSELRGSISLRTGGRYERIVIPEILRESGQPSDDPKDIENTTLRDLGVALNSTHEVVSPHNPAVAADDNSQITDKLTLFVKYASNPATFFEFTDVQGKCLKTYIDSSFLGDLPTGEHWLLFKAFCKDSLPADTQLRMTVHQDPQVVRLAFVIKDIDASTGRWEGNGGIWVQRESDQKKEMKPPTH